MKIKEAKDNVNVAYEAMRDYLTEIESNPNKSDNFFSELCDRARQTFVAGLAYLMPFETMFTLLEAGDLSPIEQSFLAAYIITASTLSGMVSWEERFGGKKHKCPLCAELLNINPQFDVEIDGKTYIIDFLICFAPMLDTNGVSYAIELDGYEWHSSKLQVNKDYERERALQKAGYKVIRFTGSQIHKDPFSCAKEVIEMIFSDSSEFVEYF